MRGSSFGASPQLEVVVSDASRYSSCMIESISSNTMHLLQSTVPESAAQSLNTGDAILLVSTMLSGSTGSSSAVRFVHSKISSSSFKLTSLPSPRSADLAPQQAFALSTAAIPLPSSDIVHLVERRSSNSHVAVFTSV